MAVELQRRAGRVNDDADGQQIADFAIGTSVYLHWARGKHQTTWCRAFLLYPVADKPRRLRISPAHFVAAVPTETLPIRVSDNQPVSI